MAVYIIIAIIIIAILLGLAQINMVMGIIVYSIFALAFFGLIIWRIVEIIKDNKYSKPVKKLIRKEKTYIKQNIPNGIEFFKNHGEKNRVVANDHLLYARYNDYSKLGALWEIRDIRDISIDIKKETTIVKQTTSVSPISAALQDSLLNSVGISVIRDADDFRDKTVLKECDMVTVDIILTLKSFERLRGRLLEKALLTKENQLLLQEAERFAKYIKTILITKRY